MGDTWSLLFSLTLPIVSYFSGATFNEALSESDESRALALLNMQAFCAVDCFGATQIEDLWIRFFAISTNVSDDRMEVHTAGPLWRYVRASMNLMGLLPPFFDHGRLLIDGGYVDNLPVEVMRALVPAAQIVISGEFYVLHSAPYVYLRFLIRR